MADEPATGSPGGRLLGNSLTSLATLPDKEVVPKLKVKKPSFAKAVGIVLDLAAEGIYEQDSKALNAELKAVALRQEKALKMVDKFLTKELNRRHRNSKVRKRK
jgi:hypothetical protein